MASNFICLNFAEQKGTLTDYAFSSSMSIFHWDLKSSLKVSERLQSFFKIPFQLDPDAKYEQADLTMPKYILDDGK